MRSRRLSLIVNVNIRHQSSVTYEAKAVGLAGALGIGVVDELADSNTVPCDEGVS